MGFKINEFKIKEMRVKASINLVPTTNGRDGEQMKSFTYPGSMVTTDGGALEDVLKCLYYVCVCTMSCLYYVHCVCTTFMCLYYVYHLTTGLLDLDAGLLARSQNPEGPATGHLDPGFLGFPGS